MSVKSKIESVEKTFFKRIDTDFKRMNTDKNMTFKHKICVNPFLYPCTSVLNCKFSTASNCIPQLKILNFGLSFWILLFGFCISGYAQEITLIYSGNTHAMIYPCNCPLEPDGGVSRRAAFIRQIRKDKTNILVVDSGDFIAGGLMDEYSQNTDLDMRRSLISIKAMEMMGYDAV